MTSSSSSQYDQAPAAQPENVSWWSWRHDASRRSAAEEWWKPDDEGRRSGQGAGEERWWPKEPQHDEGWWSGCSADEKRRGHEEPQHDERRWSGSTFGSEWCRSTFASDEASNPNEFIADPYTEIYELKIRIGKLETQLQAVVMRSEEQSNVINELLKQLGESHSRVKQSSSNTADHLETEKSASKKCATEIGDPADGSLCWNQRLQKTIEPTIAHPIRLFGPNEKLEGCIARGVHTAAFKEWATVVDFHGNGNDSTEDGEGQGPWLSWLQSMNIPIANHKTGPEEWTLANKLIGEAKRGNILLVDRHKGGKTNCHACTSVICHECGGKLVIAHPGLPAKGGRKADFRAIESVNNQLVRLFFSKQEIDRDGLEGRAFCTIERHYTGSQVYYT